MGEKLELNERCKAVLTEIIYDHIATAEPVGSRTIAKKHFEPLSAATIRNVMSELEDMGFLHQPHTSAGRVPTDKGYRYFVDQILQTKGFTDPTVFQSYGQSLKELSLEDVLEAACGILSKTSNQTGLVMLPSFSNMLFKHIEFIKVGKYEILAVFISEIGTLQNKIILTDENASQEKLTAFSNYLNQEFSNKSIKWIRKEVLRRMQNEREHYDQLMNKAMELWNQTFLEENKTNDDKLLVDGILNFFDQPEFSVNIEKMKALFRAVEEKTKLVKLLDLCLEQEGMTILIGSENEDEEMRECSLIAQSYRMDDQKMGTMAIFGSKRMDYGKMINIVDYTANTVSQLLSERKRGVK